MPISEVQNMIADNLPGRAASVGLHVERQELGEGECYFVIKDMAIDGAVVWSGGPISASDWLFGYTQGFLKLRAGVVSVSSR